MISSSLDTIILALKIIVASSVFFVWVVRYENIISEFNQYQLPDWLRDTVGILKISFTAMLFFEDSNLILLGSIGIILLMLAALGTHIKIKNSIEKMFPAIIVLLIAVIIFVFTFYSVSL